MYFLHQQNRGEVDLEEDRDLHVQLALAEDLLLPVYQAAIAR